MGFLTEAARETARGQTRDADDGADPPQAGAGVLTMDKRHGTVMVDGEEIDLADIDTQQPDEDGTWLSGSKQYGRPRGADALEARQIVQTSAMQAIVNGVARNIVGGELTFRGREDVVDGLSDSEQDALAEFKDLYRDILTGTHLQNEDLEDLIVAAVEDMMGPGEGVWQFLEPEDGDIPVAALTTLDPLTVRKNVDRHGVFGDPPYWQAHGAFGGGVISQIGSLDPVPLQADEIAVVRYPFGHRSYTGPYPISPAWQVKEWLEILANSTTHHNRFYSDNEIPPGLLQVVNASPNTIDDIKEKIQDASGDPRDVPVVGGEGGAQWLDMGGTAVNLAVVEEQRWFFFLCLGSLGLGKQELGFIEDVNRSNGEVEATQVYKRVTGPFISQFEGAFVHLAEQFDVYNDLGQPFVPTLSFSDPREERAKAERLQSEFQGNVRTLREVYRRRGDDDLAEDDDRFTIEVGGEAIDYGDHPKFVVQAMLSAAGADVDVAPDPDDEEGDVQAVIGGGAGGEPATNGGG
jgi:hypothetical protein